jgi:hypothetical protein
VITRLRSDYVVMPITMFWMVPVCDCCIAGRDVSMSALRMFVLFKVVVSEPVCTEMRALRIAEGRGRHKVKNPARPAYSRVRDAMAISRTGLAR